ncbi:Cytochrome p450 [Lasiodiplodia theobromae]|uniref:Cytochrome p450 n=1 Tax=Lasiodiplodia theobromae TaxID=45133 RepID=UPI0015C3D9CE|nr:Cytochrome p450 [Lasiodiplodia theobromae]KAF4541790.1 Cytochrome p450 [Lasiodiplodia theobromae]
MDTPQTAGGAGLSYTKVLAAVFVAAIAFRLLSGPKRDRVMPTWIPIEIFIASTCLMADGVALKLLSLFRRYGGSLFGITSQHQVIHNLKGVERLFAQPFHTLDHEPVGYTITIRVFGGEDSKEMRDALNRCKKDLFAAVEKGFVNESASLEMIQRADVGTKTYNLITFSSDPAELNPWERSANHKLIQPETSTQPGIVEAGLESLIRNFGTSVAIPLLYGSDFLKRNPQLIDDFWKFDGEVFPLRMIGIPEWAPIKSLQEGLAARSRVLQALYALYERIDKHIQGESLDCDMSDVGQVALDRCKAYTAQNVSYRHRGDIDMGLLWGQNANTQPLIYWFVVYVYATPGLLADIRAEIAPHVHLTTDAATGHARIAKIDYPALSRDCPLLKSAYLETFRLANEPSCLRYVGRDLTVADGDIEHRLRQGTYITVPLGINQRSADVYADPSKFVPERFIETDEASGKRVARYGPLKPWGMGTGICKGRTFAEKEILGVVASVASLWDFEPADGSAWRVPDMKPGTGVMRPVKDIRIRAKRRVVA